MIVSTYQPFFSPFPAFFYKAHLSDLIVILDDVQFPLGTTWINGRKAWVSRKSTRCAYAMRGAGRENILPA